MGRCKFYRAIFDYGEEMEYGLCSLSSELVAYENCDYKSCRTRKELFGGD